MFASRSPSCPERGIFAVFRLRTATADRAVEWLEYQHRVPLGSGKTVVKSRSPCQGIHYHLGHCAYRPYRLDSALKRSGRSWTLGFDAEVGRPSATREMRSTTMTYATTKARSIVASLADGPSSEQDHTSHDHIRKEEVEGKDIGIGRSSSARKNGYCHTDASRYWQQKVQVDQLSLQERYSTHSPMLQAVPTPSATRTPATITPATAPAAKPTPGDAPGPSSTVKMVASTSTATLQHGAMPNTAPSGPCC